MKILLVFGSSGVAFGCIKKVDFVGANWRKTCIIPLFCSHRKSELKGQMSDKLTPDF